MSDKKVYQSGRKNPNGYPSKGSTKRFIIISAILLAIIFAFTIEIIDLKNGDAWSNAYQNSGLIENSPKPNESELFAYFIDVGQGDCTILCNDCEVLMIDTGAPDQTNSVREALQSLNINKIDYLIITHQHDDHMGGAQTIMDNYEVSNIIMPKLSEINMVTTIEYENLLNKIKEKQIKAIAATPGYEFTIGNATCKILSPISQDKNLNNMSVVTKVTYGSTSLLFQGDAEKKAENAILSSGVDVSADVIKVGHHGSKTSSSVKYINAVSPKVAIISCGETNSYGHPHSVTLDTLKNANVDTYTTFQHNFLCVRSNGNRITVLDNTGVIKTYD